MKVVEITSFVLGILAVAISWIPIVNNLTVVLGGIAVILGAIYLFMIYSKKIASRKGFAVTGTVLGLVALIVMFATQSYYGAVLEDTTSATVSTSPTAINSSETEDAFSIIDESYTQEKNSTYVSGVLKNNVDKNWQSVSISYDFYNADGVKLGTGSDYCDGLDAGQSWKFKASFYDSEETPASYVFKEISFW